MEISMYNKIIGIIGTPRSGTSWTGQIFDSAPSVLYRMQPFYSYAFRDKIHVRSSAAEIKEFFHEMYISQDDYLLQTDRRSAGIYPVFPDKQDCPDCMVFKEVMFHYMMPVVMKHIQELSLLAIVRHPIGVLTSYYNAPGEFNPDLDIQNEWYFAQDRNEMLPERYFGYFKWKEYISIVDYLKRTYPERVQVCRYEDFSANPDLYAEKWFEHYDIEFTKQTRKFLHDSQHKTVNDPYSVFRDRSNKRQRKHLPDNIIKEIQDDLAKFSLAKEYNYQ